MSNRTRMCETITAADFVVIKAISGGESCSGATRPPRLWPSKKSRPYFTKARGPRVRQRGFTKLVLYIIWPQKVGETSSFVVGFLFYLGVGGGGGICHACSLLDHMDIIWICWSIFRVLTQFFPPSFCLWEPLGARLPLPLALILFLMVSALS